MNVKQRYDLLAQQAAILESLSKTFVAGSKDYTAIELAAWALYYAMTNHHEEFMAFVQDMAQDLTKQQRKHLAELGFDCL